MFVIEADIAPGEMHELSAALAGAIRPSQVIQRVEPPQIAPGTTESGGRIDPGPLDQDVDESSSDEFEDPSNGARGNPKPRKYRTPKPVNDLDMKSGGKAFETFAVECGSPSEHSMRYLVAAAWLGENAKIDPVTADHVYTCYKSAGWTFDVSDPGFPFRYLKKEGLGEAKGGKFTINHLGLAKVEKMAAPQA